MLLKVENSDDFTIALQKADLSPNIVFSIRKQFSKLFVSYILLLFGNLWDRTKSGELLIIATLILLTSKSPQPPTPRYDKEICEVPMRPKDTEVLHEDSPEIERDSSIFNLRQISKFKAHGSWSNTSVFRKQVFYISSKSLRILSLLTKKHIENRKTLY